MRKSLLFTILSLTLAVGLCSAQTPSVSTPKGQDGYGLAFWQTPTAQTKPKAARKTQKKSSKKKAKGKDVRNNGYIPVTGSDGGGVKFKHRFDVDPQPGNHKKLFFSVGNFSSYLELRQPYDPNDDLSQNFVAYAQRIVNGPMDLGGKWTKLSVKLTTVPKKKTIVWATDDQGGGNPDRLTEGNYWIMVVYFEHGGHDLVTASANLYYLTLHP